MSVEGLKQFIAAQVHLSHPPMCVDSCQQLMWQMVKHLASLSTFLSMAQFIEFYLKEMSIKTPLFPGWIQVSGEHGMGQDLGFQ